MKIMIRNKVSLILLGLYMTLLSGCATTGSKPWSMDDIINGSTTTTVIGNSTSYGNLARCNQYKTQCGSHYREWIQDEEIACSCVIE